MLHEPQVGGELLIELTLLLLYHEDPVIARVKTVFILLFELKFHGVGWSIFITAIARDGRIVKLLLLLPVLLETLDAQVLKLLVVVLVHLPRFLRLEQVLDELLGEVYLDWAFEDHPLRALPIIEVNIFHHLQSEYLYSRLPATDVHVEEVHREGQVGVHLLDVLIELPHQSTRRAVQRHDRQEIAGVIVDDN